MPYYFKDQHYFKAILFILTTKDKQNELYCAKKKYKNLLQYRSLIFFLIKFLLSAFLGFCKLIKFVVGFQK
jgi:hypothetical protein